MNNIKNISSTADRNIGNSAIEMLNSVANAETILINETKTDIPNFDLDKRQLVDNILLIDSSIKEDNTRVVKYRLSQKPVNPFCTITSSHTAIFLYQNCPDRTSQAVLHPEPTIFPQPVYTANSFVKKGSDNHEIEFSLSVLRSSGNHVQTGLEFDFFGYKKKIGTLFN